MENYNLAPANISEHLESLQLPSNQNLLKDVPTQTKTKLTKTYNKIHHTEKFKKEKTKSTDDVMKYDPILQEFENLKIDESENEENEEGNNTSKMVEEKKAKTKKKK